MPSYTASRAGVDAYTKALPVQLVSSGVTVTGFVPPTVATAGQEQVTLNALRLDGFLDEVTELFSAKPTARDTLV